jgi:HEAT repeat protein
VRASEIVACVFAALALTASAGCGGGASSVADKLQAEHPSERVSGCISAAERGDMSALPLLVERLEDRDADVRFFAIGALRRLTRQTLGYRYFDDARRRAGAVHRWRQWLAGRAAAAAGG